MSREPTEELTLAQTAASNHVNTALQPKQVVSAAQGSSSSSHPPWDDPEGHYIVKPDDVIANKCKLLWHASTLM